MSKSLPGGYAADGNQAAENESESDDDSDESDEKGWCRSLLSSHEKFEQKEQLFNLQCIKKI